jgi:hypothetical protein
LSPPPPVRHLFCRRSARPSRSLPRRRARRAVED